MRKRFSLEFGMLAFISLLVVIVTILGIITYKNLISLAIGLETGSKTENKISVLKQVTADLYQMESNVRTFYFTRDSSFLNDNVLTKRRIENQLDILNSYSEAGTDEFQIDSVARLVQRKFVLLDQWKTLTSDETVTTELNYLPEKLNASEKDPKQYDSSLKTKKKKKEELDPELIKSEVRKVQKEQTTQLRQLNQQEFMLNISIKQINDALLNMVNLMEAEENHIQDLKNASAIKKANTTNLIIAGFCISSVLLLVTIGYILFRYMSKTNQSNLALKNARIEAEKLAAAKQNFLANMTHEIRTPINSIIGFTEQLDKSVLNPMQKEHLQIVKKSSIHLLKIVNDVLDYSKMQSGKFTFERIIFNPSETIQEVVDILLPEAQNKGIKMDFHSTEPIPQSLLGDPFRLQQILLNILGNAIKFTGTGTIDLKIKTDHISKDEILLKVNIKDTGVGIPENMVDKVFDDFEQVETNISKRFKGTGLGLSITKKLVENQNGHIQIESAEGKGTNVSIIIPYDIVTGNSIPQREEKKIESDFLNGKRILIVDDEPFNRKLLKIILVQWGAIVEEAHDGENALSLINARPYDLILMDVRMPGMSGIEITQRLRSDQDELKRKMIIIAITASNDPEKEKRCLDAGMNAFLSKPFTERGLYELINDVINNTPIDTKETMINLTELAKLGNGDQKFMNEMLSLFVKGAQEALKSVQEAFVLNDRKAIMDSAHKIAPSCRHLGAIKLLDLVKNLEKNAQTLDEDELKKLIDEFESEILITIGEVNKHLV